MDRQGNMGNATGRRAEGNGSTPFADTAATGGVGLAHLDDLDDFKVADGQPDIRGWAVQGADGQRIGQVEDLIVDPAAMKVRYMEVELDGRALSLDQDRHVLIPVGTARLDDGADRVIVSRPSAEFAAMPAYSRDALARGTTDEQLFQSYGGAEAATFARTGSRDDLYARGDFDDRAFRGARGETHDAHDEAQYLTRSEEELTIGRRRVEAGEVTVRKHVETEHVREAVPVMRETATVERRPVRDGAYAAGGVEVAEGEIRVPLMAEEVVAEKRAVPKEELVIRKQQVQGEQIIEADLRRERIDVDRPEGFGDGATGRDDRL